MDFFNFLGNIFLRPIWLIMRRRPVLSLMETVLRLWFRAVDRGDAWAKDRLFPRLRVFLLKSTGATPEEVKEIMKAAPQPPGNSPVKNAGPKNE